jgi:hypothetical protein
MSKTSGSDIPEVRPMSPLVSWLWHVWQDLCYGGLRPLPDPDPDGPWDDDDCDDDPGGDEDYPR